MLVIIGALVGAVLGAGLWSVIAVVTGYELGYIAWGVGVLVGLGGKIAGGRGLIAGLICAALALGGILLGKAFTVQHFVVQQVQESLQEEYNQEGFDAFLLLAKEFSLIKNDDAIGQFMIKNGFTEAKSVNEIDHEERTYFNKRIATVYQRHNEEPMSYEAWREFNINDDFQYFREHFNPLSVAVDFLEPIDCVFFFLGVATAFKIVFTENESEA